MRDIQQLAQGGVAAEQRVDLEVVVRVVAMIRGRAEDRVEVDGVRTQALDVVEVI
jgi:hypothetical protein